MPAYVTENCMSSMSNVEIDGSKRKRRVNWGQFMNDPNASSILYVMRDPAEGNNGGGMKRMKVNDAKIPENQLALEMCKNGPSTSISVGQPKMCDGRCTLMGSSVDIGSPNVRDSKAVYSQRYKDVMDSLLKPVNSYTLLYEPHLVPTSKTPRKKKEKCKSPQDAQKSSQEKTPTKKQVQSKFRSFLQNVKTLRGTGMLNGAGVQYLSSSKEKELRGIIQGASYLCGCESCNYSKVVSADEFERHAGCKTSHANNHIHLENGKTLHSVVQELKSTPPTILCDAIQTVIGPSLNREAFLDWKESFEAASQAVACLRKGN